MESITVESTKKKTLRIVFRIFLLILGGALVLESLFAFRYANTRHLGIFMAFIIGLPLVLVALFYTPLAKLCRKSRLAGFLKWAMIAVYGLFALLFAFTSFLIERGARASEGVRPDVIIVLGAGIRGNYPTATLRYRLEKTFEYYCNDPNVTIIVSGGRGGDEDYSEAEVMRNWLVSQGVDPQRVIAEDKSNSTEENFLFASALIEKNADGSEPTVAFVTSRFHVFRAGRIAKKLGVDAVGIPAREFKPLILNDYLRECAAIVQYFFTGRI